MPQFGASLMIIIDDTS